ncbi:hypothetical protein KBI23_04680 [bacterium]|nr:hypothetical protein [bacterium]MBP9807189.1 hypothetical protein [bacterium]
MSDENLSVEAKEESLQAMLSSMSAGALSTLAFNLGAIAWIGLNLSININFTVNNFSIVYQPGCYISPNVLNVLSAFVLLYSGYLAAWAIYRGSLFPAIITLTFIYSMVATLIRIFL